MPANVRTTGRGRFYLDAQGRAYWSVTTILSVVPKPAIPYWAAKAAAEYAVDHLDAVEKILDGGKGRAAAIDHVKRAPWRYATKRADIGTAVHAAIEAYILKRPFPEYEDEIAAHMRQFEAFLATWKPTFEASEITVYNRTQSYAGRSDGVMMLGGERVIFDIKTGSGIYPETALQLAAYAHAEFMELPDGREVALGDFDGGIGLHITPRDFAVIPLRIDDTVFQAFLYAREMYRWQNDISHSAMAPALQPGYTVSQAVAAVMKHVESNGR